MCGFHSDTGKEPFDHKVIFVSFIPSLWTWQCMVSIATHTVSIVTLKTASGFHTWWGNHLLSMPSSCLVICSHSLHINDGSRFTVWYGYCSSFCLDHQRFSVLSLGKSVHIYHTLLFWCVGSILLKRLGVKLAPKLVYFVLRNELNFSGAAPWCTIYKQT